MKVEGYPSECCIFNREIFVLFLHNLVIYTLLYTIIHNLTRHIKLIYFRFPLFDKCS